MGLFEIKIAIPSYNRINKLHEQTLSVLSKNNISKEQITIFTDISCFDDYSAKLGGYNVVISPKGIVPTRNFIVEYYEEDTPLVILDDDVRRIVCLKDNMDLSLFFQDAFSLLVKEKCNLWGVYPVPNRFFMDKKKNEYSIHLTHILGGFNGRFNKKDIILSEECAFKEEFENSILFYLRDKKIIRFNKISYNTAFYAKGGINDSGGRTIETERQHSLNLEEKYPDFVRLFVRKKNGRTDIRFNKRI